MSLENWVYKARQDITQRYFLIISRWNKYRDLHHPGKILHNSLFLWYISRADRKKMWNLSLKLSCQAWKKDSDSASKCREYFYLPEMEVMKTYLSLDLSIIRSEDKRAFSILVHLAWFLKKGFLMLSEVSFYVPIIKKWYFFSSTLYCL